MNTHSFSDLLDALVEVAAAEDQPSAAMAALSGRYGPFQMVLLDPSSEDRQALLTPQIE
jgi:hypothetical protein